MGLAIRASASQDHEAAYVLGVGINRIVLAHLRPGPALGGLAGVLVGLYYNAVYPTMGGMMGLKAFSAYNPGRARQRARRGRGRDLPRRGGEPVRRADPNAGYRHVFSFAILILFLLFRPQGLFGRKENIR